MSKYQCLECDEPCDVFYENECPVSKCCGKSVKRYNPDGNDLEAFEENEDD